MNKVFATILFLVLIPALTVQAEQKKEITFVVHPFKSPSKLRSMFTPLLKHMEKKLGYKIVFRTGKSYEDVIDLYNDGTADFGYLGPAGYVNAARKKLVKPLARIMYKGKGTFNGVIVVKNQSSISAISDLKDKSFAFGDKNSTLSHYVPHYMLLKENVPLSELSEYKFTGKHDNVAQGVLLGLFDAGGLKPAVANNYLDKGLRILATSEPISEHLFVVNSKLDKKMADKIRQLLLKVKISLLTPIKKGITGIEPVKSSDYDNLRKIIDEVNKQEF